MVLVVLVVLGFVDVVVVLVLVVVYVVLVGVAPVRAAPSWHNVPLHTQPSVGHAISVFQVCAA